MFCFKPPTLFCCVSFFSPVLRFSSSISHDCLLSFFSDSRFHLPSQKLLLWTFTFSLICFWEISTLPSSHYFLRCHTSSPQTSQRTMKSDVGDVNERHCSCEYYHAGEVWSQKQVETTCLYQLKVLFDLCFNEWWCWREVRIIVFLNFYFQQDVWCLNEICIYDSGRLGKKTQKLLHPGKCRI